MAIAVGTACLVPSGPGNLKHLCCVIARFHPSQPLYVTISTIPDDGLSFDATCILGSGDHSFLRHDSFVYYRRIEQFSEKVFQSNIDSGVFPARDDFADEVVARIVKGALASPQTRGFVREILNKTATE